MTIKEFRDYLISLPTEKDNDHLLITEIRKVNDPTMKDAIETKDHDIVFVQYWDSDKHIHIITKESWEVVDPTGVHMNYFSKSNLN
jgi:hypothetical protein